MLLKKIDVEDQAFLRRIVAIDETWIRDFESELKSQSNEWRGSAFPRPKQFRQPQSKSLVYETPIESEEERIARVLTADDPLQHMPGVFERVRQAMIRCCSVCIEAEDRTFVKDYKL
ncbi:hypothetical protein ANN_10040 [Periplaneta americana]|uniref:Uncharacterized protein n=1 Tax=Periplaneta americana TaxID=6978 RepID=A0ABQ8TNZ4_PERAM|nr:hypothetical protein ANN_10040 [Periplaneta americana]